MANVSTSTLIPIGSYTVDQHHSYIGFEVKHLSLATVRGSFNRFSATIESAEDGLHARATIDAASVDTRVPSRDDDLRGAHFFDVEKFPEISFSSDVVTANENGGVIATGNLTIKGVTRPVELRGSVGESQEDPWGDRRVGFGTMKYLSCLSSTDLQFIAGGAQSFFIFYCCTCTSWRRSRCDAGSPSSRERHAHPVGGWLAESILASIAALVLRSWRRAVSAASLFD